MSIEAMSNIKMGRLSVPELRVTVGRESLVYKPQEDVTNIELAHLLRLFVALIASDTHHSNYDAAKFIEQYGLQRHFKKMRML